MLRNVSKYRPSMLQAALLFFWNWLWDVLIDFIDFVQCVPTESNTLCKLEEKYSLESRPTDPRESEIRAHLRP